MRSLPIANCRLPILKRNRIGIRQSAIGNRQPAIGNWQLAFGITWIPSLKTFAMACEGC